MRAIAVLGVFVFHAGAFAGGFWGVDVFFVLSGFLITALLLAEHDRSGRIGLGAFYARRALRLLPALALLLAVYAVFNAATNPAGVRWGPPLAAFFYTANWVQALALFPMGSLSHTWSLAIEEQFYLLWPVALALLLRLGVGRMWCVVITVLAIDAVAVLRLGLWKTGATFARVYNGLDTRLDALLVGCVLAMIVTWYWPRVRAWRPSLRAGAALGAVVVVMAAAGAQFRSHLSYQGTSLAVAVAVAVVVGAVVVGVRIPLLASAPLVWMGRVSYGFYLWHYFVLGNIGGRLQLGWAATVAVCFIASLALTAVSYYALERPLLKLKARLRPSPAPPAELAAARV